MYLPFKVFLHWVELAQHIHYNTNSRKYFFINHNNKLILFDYPINKYLIYISE